MPNLDFSNVPSRDPLQEGLYNLLIEEVEEKVSSTGKPMFLVRFKEPETGAAIFENYVLTPNALWKLKELCDALGVDTSGQIDSSELATQIKGEMVKCKVIQDTYDGSIMNRVKKVFAA